MTVDVSPGANLGNCTLRFFLSNNTFHGSKEEYLQNDTRKKAREKYVRKIYNKGITPEEYGAGAGGPSITKGYSNYYFSITY